MPDVVPDVVPLANIQCPLCGQPNSCAAANTGDFNNICWCKTKTIPPELLAQVDPEQRNKSCICQNCANHFHLQHSR
jgi:hypothetical protein